MTFAVSAEQLVRLGLHIPAQLLLFLTIGLFVLGFRVRPWWAWGVAAFALVAASLSWLVNYPPVGVDLKHFWVAGGDLWAGENPYARPAILSPPTAFPLYALFGLLPYPVLLATWTALSLVGAVALVAGTHAAFAPCDDEDSWRLPLPMVAVVAAAMGMSVAVFEGMRLGQLGLFASGVIVLAMAGRLRGQSVTTGAGLALASIKTPTMLPFLLLFLRLRDWRVWAALTVIGFALALAFVSPDVLPARLSDCLANIGHQAEPGGANVFWHRTNVDMIGIDRALYYCGVTDRTALRILQGVALLLVLGWVAWQVRGPRPLPDAAAWSLTALASMLFLYHRLYDLPVLVIPLLYGLGRARAERGLCGWCYAGCAGAILALLFFRYDTVKQFSYAPPLDGWLGSVAVAVIVPITVWLLLAAMGLLSVAEHLRQRARKSSVETPVQHTAQHRILLAEREYAEPLLS